MVLYHNARFVGRPTGGTGTSVTGSGESGGPSTPTTARESGARHPTSGRPARNSSSTNSDAHPPCRTPPTLHALPKPSTSLVEPRNRPRVRCWTRSAIFDWCRLALTTSPAVPVGYASCGTQGPEQARPGLRPYVAYCRPLSPPPTVATTTATSPASRRCCRRSHVGTLTCPDPGPLTPSENRSLAVPFSHTQLSHHQ